MGTHPDSPMDQLWAEYRLAFKEFDDLTLARWLAQTLGQLRGKAWRFTHPLVGAYRLAAQVAHERQIWLKLLASPPAGYPESGCCRAPVLPLLTRDVSEAGLICEHCGESVAAFEDIPPALQGELKEWADKYSPVHAVAHWDEGQRRQSQDYDRALEAAAEESERLLSHAGQMLAPKLLEYYPAVIWEDQDECLEVRPEDILL